MTLIKSISGIRGTIGGKQGDGLSPLDVVKFTSAYGEWLKQRNDNKKLKVVVGRDARISGEMVRSLVCSALMGLGIDVVDLGLSTTPTVEIAVTDLQTDGGIIITASHNPKNWNALKLLNEKGEFLNADDGAEVLANAEKENFSFAEVDYLGHYVKDDTFIQKHIQKVITLPLVDIKAIQDKQFRVAIDCVNSTGGIAIPALLRALGVKEIVELFCKPDGHFPHNPEPLPEHLTAISAAVVESKSHVGFVVDPDVDRLAIICEDGSMFGEEYTLVSIADYVLQNMKGSTVSNLSSTFALRDVTQNAGCTYFTAAVGEVNVVAKMKEKNAVIGGEGNGGVIFPELHYGRDALVGIALFLTHLAKQDLSCKQLRKTYPEYFISKNKIQLTPEINVDKILTTIAENYKDQKVLTIDGVKIEFEKEWVHLRKSNTEPIIRIYSESRNEEAANLLAKKIISEIQSMIK